MLVIDNIDAAYGRRPVLQGATMQAAPGEVVAVLGLNGSGKSTLLKCVAGLVRCTAGDISFNGKPLRGLPPGDVNRLGVGYLPQGHHVFPSLTVADHLRLAVELKSNGGERAGVLALFPILGPLRGRRAGLLSAGERQAVAVAMLLLQEPTLMLLDEPCAALALPTAQGLLGHVKELCRREQRTAVIVEQEVELALSVADRAFLAREGRLWPMKPASIDSRDVAFAERAVTGDSDPKGRL